MHVTTLPGITASVWSGGTELKEYDDPDDGDKEGPLSNVTASCYIEAIDGANFEIRLQALPSYEFDCERLGAEVHVDGKNVELACLTPDSRKGVCRGVQKPTADATKVTLHKYLFSKIGLSEYKSLQLLVS